MRLIDADYLLNAVEKLKVRNTSNTTTIFDILGVLIEVYTKNEYYKGYAKGKKRGISIGSQKTYNYFIKQGHWEESKCLDDCFWVCSCCKFPSQAIAAPKLYKYCPNCGARMDIAED